MPIGIYFLVNFVLNMVVKLELEMNSSICFPLFLGYLYSMFHFINFTLKATYLGKLSIKCDNFMKKLDLTMFAYKRQDTRCYTNRFYINVCCLVPYVSFNYNLVAVSGCRW